MNIEVVGADIKYAQIQAPTSRKSAPVPSAILHNDKRRGIAGWLVGV